MKDEYKTIQSERRDETKVQGSRFIATVSPVSTRIEADIVVERIRKEFWNATHHCFAYRLGMGNDTFRFNDDGEPNGSAGKPILAAMDKFELTDTIVVVTRYFGGTKLGVGGLIRAYGGSAEQALAKAKKVVRFKTEIVQATFPHSHISNVMHVVSKAGARIVDTLYDEDVHAMLEIRLTKKEELRAALTNQTNGNISFKTVPTEKR